MFDIGRKIGQGVEGFVVWLSQAGKVREKKGVIVIGHAWRGRHDKLGGGVLELGVQRVQDVSMAVREKGMNCRRIDASGTAR